MVVSATATNEARHNRRSARRPCGRGFEDPLIRAPPRRAGGPPRLAPRSLPVCLTPPRGDLVAARISRWPVRWPAQRLVPRHLRPSPRREGRPICAAPVQACIPSTRILPGDPPAGRVALCPQRAVRNATPPPVSCSARASDLAPLSEGWLGPAMFPRADGPGGDPVPALRPASGKCAEVCSQGFAWSAPGTCPTHAGGLGMSRNGRPTPLSSTRATRRASMGAPMADGQARVLSGDAGR